jgi:predicted RNA-binding Zn-ribbon protein involved in translation (DUF1610 family)
VTTIASTRRPDVGMICAQCGDLMITPEWSEYDDARHVSNLWSCKKCGCLFETEALVPADAEANDNDFAIKAFFPSLLVA